MFNLNGDGFASAYSTQQLNPWNGGLAHPLGHAGLQAWQQQLALQLAQQRVAQIALALHGLTQQLMQLASQGNQHSAQSGQFAQPGQQFSLSGQPFAQLGQPFIQSGQPFVQPPQQLGLH
jgi:hypothetical protein